MTRTSFLSMITATMLLWAATSHAAASPGSAAGTFSLPTLDRLPQVSRNGATVYATSDIAGVWRFYSHGTYSTNTDISFGTIVFNTAGQITYCSWWDNFVSGTGASGTVAINSDGQYSVTITWPNGITTVIVGQLSADKNSTSGVYVSSSAYMGIFTMLRP